MNLRYYVAKGSDRTGPFTLEELRTVPLTRETLVWAQGMTEWLPAEQVTDLLPLLPDPAGARPPAAPAASLPSDYNDFIIANPRLPRMARAICAYALVVNPALWLLENLWCLAPKPPAGAAPAASGSMYIEWLPAAIGLVIMMVLLIGGLQLRVLRRVGVTLLKTGICLNVAWTLLVFCFVWVAVAAQHASAPPGQPPPARPSPGTFELLLVAARIAAFAWEVVSLVWLTRHRDRLPI